MEYGKFGVIVKRLIGMIRLQRSGYDNSVQEELDPIRSEWGAHLSVLTTQTQVGSLTSGKTFHLQSLIINNDDASQRTYYFYDSTSTATPSFKIAVAANSTWSQSGLKLKPFTTGVYVVPDAVLSSQVTIGGTLRDD